MKSTTTEKTLEVLHNLFTAYGLPELLQLVSDNGPQFTSSEFESCMRANSIKHIWTSPYHPASSGEAERFVQTFKHAMRAGEKDDWVTSWQTIVCTRLDYSACLTILGIEIGSVDQELNLPQYKIKWVKQTIQHWRARKCCTLRGLQSVIRLLSHVCKVVHPGRVFLGCMFWLAASVQHLSHQLRLIKQRLSLNLEWWHCFLEAWNGTSLCGQFNPKLLVHMTHLGIGAVEPT